MRTPALLCILFMACTAPDTDSSDDTDVGSDPGLDSDVDTGTEADTEADTDADTDTGIDGDTDGDTEPDTDADTEPDTDEDTEPDTDEDTEPDTDQDSDGVVTALDCDDSDADVGLPTQWFPDCDGDSYTADVSVTACDPGEETCPDGSSPDGGWSPDSSDPIDCDDADASRYPTAPETPGDGVDSDCDGEDPDALTDLYVAKSGSDTNPGTREEPFLTVAHAFAQAEPGHTVHVAEGTYEETVLGQVSLIGGYSDDTTWTYEPDTFVTTLTAPSEATEPAVTLHRELFSTTVLAGVTIEGPETALQLGESFNVFTDVDVDDLTVIGTAQFSGTRGTLDGSHFTGVTDRALYLQGLGTQLTVTDINVDHQTPDEFGAGALYIRSGATVTVHDATLGPAYTALRAPDGTVTVHHSTLTATRNAAETDNAQLTLLDCDIHGGSSGVLSQGTGSFLVARSVITTSSGPTFKTRAVGANNGGTGTVIASALYGGDRGGVPSMAAEAFHDGTLVIVNSYLYGGSGFSSSAVTATIAGTLDPSHVTVVNSVLDAGDGTNDSHMLNLAEAGTATLVNNVFEPGPDVLVRQYVPSGNTGVPSGTVTTLQDLHACTWAGCTAASGNLEVAAQLTDPASEDWSPQAGSPVTEGGVDPSPYVDSVHRAEDIFGEARPIGAWDVGPVEE